ncbi:MAG TPA: hydrogenase maturation protease [Terriglobales bacterium]|nr:hydrogenase maturation protease [Terriglobales bacterium]
MRIICCGNRERGDDAAGVLVGERLRDLGIEAQTVTRDAFSLIKAWTGAEDVVVVDTVTTNAPAGKVHVWKNAQFIVPRRRTSSTHGFGVAEAIELARAIGCLPARLRLYGIEGKKFGFGNEVSPEVRHGVAEVVRKIAAEVKIPQGLV